MSPIRIANKAHANSSIAFEPVVVGLTSRKTSTRGAGVRPSLRRGLLSTTAIVGVSAALLFATHADALVVLSESTWNGATSDYNSDLNWTPFQAPVAAGQSAIFSTAGVNRVIVGSTITPDAWRVIAGSYTFTGAAVTFGGSGLTVGAYTEISNDISGIGGVTVTSGSLFLAGTNTYTGQTTVSANSYLTIGNSGETGSISGDIVNNGTLFFRRTNAYTFGGVISGNGAVEQVAPGTTTLTGANTYSGGTTVSSGTLQIGDGAVSGSITGDVVNNATLAFNRSDALTFNGVISGDGAVNQIGAGTTTLTGDNTYLGGTTISAGTLQIGSGATSGSITGDVVNNATLAFNRSDDVAFSGVISGSGAVNQIGTGTTTLAGDNTYTGDTRILSGTLQVGDGGTSGALGTGNVSNQGTLVFNRSDALTFAGVVGNTGSVRQIGAGTTTLTGENVYTGGTTISAGTLQIGNGGTSGSITGDVVNNAALAFNRSDDVTFSGVISGSGVVNQIGTGATSLTGANTYTGDTTVSNGALVVGDAYGSGSISSNVINAATFINNGTVTGTLTNNAGSATNFGFITGAVTVSGGSFDNYGNVAGATTNNGGDATNYGILAAVTTTGGYFVNTGTITGATTVSGGTFYNIGTINGGLTNSATFYVDGGSINGAIANNAGGFYVGSAFTSNNTFANASGAMLEVGGGSSYTLQGLLTNAGTLTVGNHGLLDATAGGLTNTRTGTVIVARGGTLRDDLNNAGTVTNNGAATANVATNTGTITNTSTGTWTGNVASSTGAIVNNGAWTGTINSSGSYSGTGSVSGLSLTGGRFAPGNGTPGSSTTVNGNLALASGVQYVVQVNPATASFASVTGTAALGGAAVTANFATGSYVARQYTILTAAGGRTGTFGALTNTNLPANFTTSLSYDANRAYLDLTLGFTTARGLNRNQQSVANTLTGTFNRTGGIPLAFGSLSAAGLSQASGELGAGTQQAAFDAMGLFMGMMTDPSTAGRGDTVPQGAIGYAEEAPRAPGDAMAAMSRKAPATLQFEQRWNVWSAGFGGSQTTDGSAAAGSSTASSRIYGGAVGADYRFSPDTTAGFALAGGGTSFSVANGGSGRSDLFQAGGFIRHSVGATYLTAAMAYGWQDVTTDRSVGADRFNARFSTNTLSGRLEAGHRWIEPVLGMGLTPYAAAQVTSVSLPSYTETAGAGSAFGLNYAGKDATATRSELGLRTDKAFAVTDGVMTLRSRAAWAHNFNPDRSITATFQALPGASFVVNGAAQAREAALVTASAEMAWLNGWTLAGTFEGEFSNVTRSYAGKAVVRYGW